MLVQLQILLLLKDHVLWHHHRRESMVKTSSDNQGNKHFCDFDPSRKGTDISMRSSLVLNLRNRLSREQFQTLLANINARRQTREVHHCKYCNQQATWFISMFLSNVYMSMHLVQETLKKAEEIFGTDNQDLYLWFHALLNRNNGV